MAYDLQSLKKHDLDEAAACGVPVVAAGEAVGALIPVGPWILNNPNLISQIADWRGRAMTMFLAQFESTPSKTRSYLETLSIRQPNRILFMIEVANTFVGHIGLTNVDQNSGEVDNLMQGVSAGSPDLMLLSERALVAWSFQTLNLSRLVLKILSHNFQARALHERLGFVTTERSPLRRIAADDGTVLVPCERSDATVKFTCDVMALDESGFRFRQGLDARAGSTTDTSDTSLSIEKLAES